jgi:hypothetical protein
MHYRVDPDRDGWRLIDPALGVTVDFGGVPLEGLTMEEVTVMLEWLTQRDRALAREANKPGWLIGAPVTDESQNARSLPETKVACRPEQTGESARWSVFVGRTGRSYRG